MKIRWRSWFLVWGLLAAAAACRGGESIERELPEGQPASAVSTAQPEAASDATVRVISRDEVQALMESDGAPVLLDVRTAEEYAEGHIPGAINIPYDSVEGRLEDLKSFQERGLIVYCRTGRRAGIAENVLVENGIENVWDLEGHIQAWREEGRPLEGADSGT